MRELRGSSASSQSHTDSPKSTSPTTDVGPVELANRLAAEYMRSAPRELRKRQGQFFTTPSIARYMASLFSPRRSSSLRVLDPGAGTGILSAAVCERMSKSRACKRIHLDAYETSKNLLPALGSTLRSCKTYLGARGIEFTFDILNRDFVTSCAHRLGGMFAFDPGKHEETSYDLVVSNPPYQKIRKRDPRAAMASTVVRGQPNLYALFMATAAYMLRRGGTLVFIVPRSFASGAYFRQFRSAFFSEMVPRVLHVFESRCEAFAEQDVLQENLVIQAQRDGLSRVPATAHVDVRTSHGATDINTASRFALPLSKVMDVDRPGAPLRIPSSVGLETVCEFLLGWPETVESLGYKVSTGPVVPFRAREFQVNRILSRTVPFLWMQHVMPMRVVWPLSSFCKPQFFRASERSIRLLLRCLNYVLVRRFSAKEQSHRITAAPLVGWSAKHDHIALENHLNYITGHSKALSAHEAIGVAAVLNSPLLDVWFRTVNGNTQVSATELRSMPMPDKRRIVEIGVALSRNGNPDQAGITTLSILDIPRDVQELALGAGATR